MPARDDIHPLVAHRGGLATRVTLELPQAVFADMGGRETVTDLIDNFYDRLEADPQLSPKFTNSTRIERENQKKFFEEWLGGEALYSQHVAISNLSIRHDHIHIAPPDAKAWLAHFRAALKHVRVALPQTRAIMASLKPIAEAFINEPELAESGEHRCFRHKKIEAARNAAQRGNQDAVSDIVADDQLLSEAGPNMLFAAASRGRAEVVGQLLAAHVDPNLPTFVGWNSGYQTPLCIATVKRKKSVVSMLTEAGAVDDIFTAATLGDQTAVQDWIARAPELVNVADPASDFFPLTALHYAVAAEAAGVALKLLTSGAEVGVLSTKLTKQAVDSRDFDLTRHLLQHGADATRIGVGRWVLEEDFAELLFAHGADIHYEPDPWASWQWQTCTGNHNQKDDPSYVQELLRLGVAPNAIQPYFGRAALHFAAKAGFCDTIQALVDAGANVNLPDAKNHETPLFHAFKAGKSVDIQSVVDVLLDAGADLSLENARGRTVKQAHPRSVDYLP